MNKDDPENSLYQMEDENHNNTNYVRPPKDQPDDGMGTAREDALTADEISPKQKDGGMSAGYPP